MSSRSKTALSKYKKTGKDQLEYVFKSFLFLVENQITVYFVDEDCDLEGVQHFELLYFRNIFLWS